MKHIVLLLVAAFSLSLNAQDTFSIVAVDTLTGEVGSAGASCLDNISFPGSGGAIIISDILPGKGAIHTQSFWNATNQANARLKMEEGLAPQEILDWLKANDPQGPFGAQSRQYGIVDLDNQGHPRSAAFTGNGCLDWKGHRTGSNYAIQGNILLGPQILDSMEARFLNATGTLADRLMAAMQGANVPGADSRCLNNGTSSLSAFLRVARPDDEDDNLYLDLNVPSLPAGQEPIDSLQTLYNQWLLTSTHTLPELDARLFPNPASNVFFVVTPVPNTQVDIFDLNGVQCFSRKMDVGKNTLSPDMPPGVYLVKFSAPGKTSRVEKLFWQKQ